MNFSGQLQPTGFAVSYHSAFNKLIGPSFMSSMSYLPPSLVRVEKISLLGPGVVILTGPSSCGKGEVAASLCELLSIDTTRHLSMGGILRTTVEKAKTDHAFAAMLAEKYSLSHNVSIFDCIDSSDELTEKVRRYQPKYFVPHKAYSFPIAGRRI